MTGLIETSHFFCDISDPEEEAGCVLSFTSQTKERNLNIHTLVDQGISAYLIEEVDERHMSNATHVVVGIVYGAEAYCVLKQDLDSNNEEDEEARKEAQENVSNIAKKFENALSKKLPLAKFKEILDEKENYLLETSIKCIFYSDRIKANVRECNLFDIYKHILLQIKLHVSATSPQNSRNIKSVPIAVKLFPLKCLSGPRTEIVVNKTLSFGSSFEVDESEITSCEKILAKYKRIIKRVNEFYDPMSEIIVCYEFINCIYQYQNLLQNLMKDCIVKARSSPTQYRIYLLRIINKAEDLSLFSFSRLEQFLDWKDADQEVLDLMASAAGTQILFLIDTSQLERHKYAIVLTVPPLLQRNHKMLEEMGKCLNNINSFEDFIEYQSEVEESDQLCWQSIPRKRIIVLDKISQLAAHVEKNRHISDQFQSYMKFSESSAQFSCSYSIYEAGKLLKGNVRRLPDVPTGLRIHHPVSIPEQSKKAKKDSTSVEIEWNYGDFGYPCNFIVEHRLKGSADPWIQQKTEQKQQILTFEIGSTMEIRVAADSCIGRGEFSDAIDSEFVEDDIGYTTEIPIIILPTPTQLEVIYVSATTAKLRWEPSAGIRSNLSYHVSYWNKEDPSTVAETTTECDVTTCCLYDLQPETTYLFKVALCQQSEPSETAEFTTTKVIRFADKLLNRCKRTSRINGLYNYAVPLIKLDGTTADRFVFDPRNELGRPGGLHRTILLVGDCFSDKTLLINAMINWIFNVQFEDAFRFQLIQSRHYEEANQKKVIVYDIHHAEGFRIPYSLTIIDTPSYVDQDRARNLHISKTISTFFSDGNGLFQELDMVGFVVDSSESELMPLHLYISCSLVSIFGEDIKENINYIFNFSDQLDESYFWSDIVDAGLVPYGPFKPHCQQYHRLSKSTLIPSDREFCRSDSQDFGNFFRSLEHATTKSLTFSKQLLIKKTQLEAVMNGLHKRLREEASEMEELRHLFHIFSTTANMPSVAESRFTLFSWLRSKKESLFGEYSTNCTNCLMTCHIRCGFSNEKKNCDVMDHLMPEESRTCLVCPNRCLWSAHASQPFQWVYTRQLKSVSCCAIKEQYEAKLERNLTSQELSVALKKDAKAKRKYFGKLFLEILLSVKQFNQILRRLDPKAMPEFMNIIDDSFNFVSEMILDEITEERRCFRVWTGKLNSFARLAFEMKTYGPFVLEDLPSWGNLANYEDEEEDENEETDEEEDESEDEEEGEGENDDEH